MLNRASSGSSCRRSVKKYCAEGINPVIDPGMASRQRDGVLRALARWRVPHVAGKEAEAQAIQSWI